MSLNQNRNNNQEENDVEQELRVGKAVNQRVGCQNNRHGTFETGPADEDLFLERKAAFIQADKNGKRPGCQNQE